jgi:hypothetical protein
MAHAESCLRAGLAEVDAHAPAALFTAQPSAPGLCLGLAGGTGPDTAPPSDGILDETRALSAETHRHLAEEFVQFHESLKFEGWIRACSFMPQGTTVRRQAQTTRRDWSSTRPAVLMLYDRASNSGALSFAPVLWERYPAAGLVGIMQETQHILADTRLTLDERLAVATRTWIDRIRTLETVRLKQSLWLQRSEKRFIVVVPSLLVGGAVIAALLGFISRRRSSEAGRRFVLPAAQVGARFGAAYGGGVTAEIKTNAGSH